MVKVKTLNPHQLELLANYMSQAIQNNQEVHPEDIPHVMNMFRLIAEYGYVISEEQVDVLCKFIHSESHQEMATSEDLKSFLKNAVAVFEYYAIYHDRKEERFRRQAYYIARDIINENNVDYGEEVTARFPKGFKG